MRPTQARQPSGSRPPSTMQTRPMASIPFTPSASTRKAQLRAQDLKRITASLQKAGKAVIEGDSEDEIDQAAMLGNRNPNPQPVRVASGAAVPPPANGNKPISRPASRTGLTSAPSSAVNRPSSRAASSSSAPPPAVASLNTRSAEPAASSATRSRTQPATTSNPPPSTARVSSRSAMAAPVSSKSNTRAKPLSALVGLSVKEQEKLIIADLLWVLSGVEGELITYTDDYRDADVFEKLNGAAYIVDDALDNSLAPLLQRILPLGAHLTCLNTFIETRQIPDYGSTTQALLASISSHLDDFAYVVADLESQLYENPQAFTLQSVWYHLQNSFFIMRLLAELVRDIVSISEGPVDGDEENEEESDDEAMQAIMGKNFKDVLKNLQKSEQDKHQSGIVKGGELINIVYEKLNSSKGDPRANNLLSGILKACSQPYLKILLQWTSTGVLRDPYEEVMVQETMSITKGNLDADYTDEYWGKRYTLRDGSSQSTSTLSDADGLAQEESRRKSGGSCIPPFLESWKFKILLAGKYLNVVREFGLDVPSFAIEWELDECVGLNDPRFLRHVETAYTTANKTLLALLLSDQQLVPRLRSLKHYFFLPQADFFNHFLDLAATELRKTARAASGTKLQNLLDLSLRNPASTSAQDPYKEDVCVSMASSTLYQWLETIIKIKGTSEEDIAGGIQNLEFDGAASKTLSNKTDTGKTKPEKDVIAVDALQFDYNVPFPLSLVISRKTILRYQIIFRFLLHLKYTEMALCSMWQGHMYDRGEYSVWRKNNHNAQFEKWKVRVCVLRARMLAFIQQVLGFVTSEVIEPNWILLEKTLEDVPTVDILLREHVDFLDTCLKECMLTNATMIKVYQKIILTCYTFTSYANNFNRQAVTVQTQVEGMDENEQLDMDEVWKFLLRFEENFDIHIKVHLDHITALSTQENTALLALVVRLSSLSRS